MKKSAINDIIAQSIKSGSPDWFQKMIYLGFRYDDTISSINDSSCQTISENSPSELINFNNFHENKQPNNDISTTSVWFLASSSEAENSISLWLPQIDSDFKNMSDIVLKEKIDIFFTESVKAFCLNCLCLSNFKIAFDFFSFYAKKINFDDSLCEILIQNILKYDEISVQSIQLLFDGNFFKKYNLPNIVKKINFEQKLLSKSLPVIKVFLENDWPINNSFLFDYFLFFEKKQEEINVLIKMFNLQPNPLTGPLSSKFFSGDDQITTNHFNIFLLLLKDDRFVCKKDLCKIKNYFNLNFNTFKDIEGFQESLIALDRKLISFSTNPRQVKLNKKTTKKFL